MSWQDVVVWSFRHPISANFLARRRLRSQYVCPFLEQYEPAPVVNSFVHVGNLAIPSARLEIEIFLRSIMPGRQIMSEQCWLDTGAPLSVIPFHVHHQRAAWRPVPSVTLTWAGQTVTLVMSTSGSR